MRSIFMMKQKNKEKYTENVFIAMSFNNYGMK